MTAAATSPLVLAHTWWGIVWGLVMVAFWVALIAAIVVLLRAVAGRPGAAGSRPALQLLEERYASGEITREEFLDRRAVLTDTRTERQG